LSALQDAIRRRRTIRSFSGDPVPEAVLVEVLDAGRWAPSPGNAQPWRVVVVTEEENKGEFLKAVKDSLREELLSRGVDEGEASKRAETSIEPLYSAPILIVPCLTKEIYGEDSGKWLTEKLMGTQCVAAFIQNMLLAASEQGLGSCWVSAAFPCQTEVRRALEIPQSAEPQALIALGYAEEDPEPPVRKPIGEVVYMERWGEEYRYGA